jgi:hypothetical protein
MSPVLDNSVRGALPFSFSVVRDKELKLEDGEVSASHTEEEGGT